MLGNRITARKFPVFSAQMEKRLQCGFCTPGFVMSLFAMFHNNSEKSIERGDIDLGLAGNLCRCTGYDKIVRAVLDAASEMREAV